MSAEKHSVIRIKGARQHNLRNLDIEIPRHQLVVVTGMSGSGKSSLAFDTLFAEGQRKYVESLSAYARQFLDQMQKPDVDYIEGLSPAIAIEQRISAANPRSTIATTTEIYDYLRLLYAAVGTPHDPQTGQRVARQTPQEIADGPRERSFSFSRRSSQGSPANSAMSLKKPAARALSGFASMARSSNLRTQKTSASTKPSLTSSKPWWTA